MAELWLNFNDEKGERHRVLVEKERFVVGRTPDNDLQIPLGSVSRQHVRFERFAEIIVVSDCGSSNGTKLNGENLGEPTAIKNGDNLLLGEALEIEIEIVSSQNQGATASLADEPSSNQANGAAAKASAGETKISEESSGFNWTYVLLAPLLGIFLLCGAGVAFLLSKGNPAPEISRTKTTNFEYKAPNDEDEDFPTADNRVTTTEKTPSPSPANVSGNGGSNQTATPAPTEDTSDSPTIPSVSEESQKIEATAAAFLRRIAQNDSRAFLTTKQVDIVRGKINQFKGSSSLAENIRSAKNNSSQIASLAQSKNLKPQFLATAALAKLGNQKGDALAAAREMLETLDNLSVVLGNELANDNLLVIAVYDQGVAGQNLKLRDTLANLTKEFPGSTSAQIRTIWFLKEKNKITESEFEFALRFLAIGIITQNPKIFNVQAEALQF